MPRNTLILLFLIISCYGREIVVLDDRKKDVKMKNMPSYETTSTFFNEVSKKSNCNIVAYSLSLPEVKNTKNYINNEILKKELELLKPNLRAFYLRTVTLGTLLSLNNIKSNKDICYTVMIKNDSSYFFKIATQDLNMIKNRDFGTKDLELVEKEYSSNDINNKLPIPLINIFKNIKVGYLNSKNNYNFEINIELTKKYHKFLKNFQFSEALLGFNESTIHDVWQLKKEKITYIKEQKKYILKKQKELANLRDKQKRNMCVHFVNDLPVYNACLNNSSMLIGYGNKYGWIASAISKKDCASVAGNDTSGLALVCERGRSGCASLEYRQEVIDACFSCNGSNRWLRMFAASLINGKILPKCY